MTRLLADALAPGVRVNAVAPGLVDTPGSEDRDTVRESVRLQAPLQRTTTPDDVAEVVLGLVHASYVTGEVLLVDGGLNLRCAGPGAPPGRACRLPWRDVHRPTVDVYEDRGLRWAATHRRAGRAADAASFDAAVPAGAPRIDLGCGAGRYAPLLGAPLIGLDASAVMLAACREAVPGSRYVVGDVEALPFTTGSLAGAWSNMTHHHVHRVDLPLALWDLHRVLGVGAVFDLQVVAGHHEGTGLPDDELGGRLFTGWTEAQIADVVTGAGFAVDDDSVAVEGDELRLRARRARTLADTVGPGMAVLVCGLNPSPGARPTEGVGFARPGQPLLAGGAGRRAWWNGDRDPLTGPSRRPAWA